MFTTVGSIVAPSFHKNASNGNMRRQLGSEPKNGRCGSLTPFLAGIGPKYGKAKYTQSTAQGYPAEHHYPSSAAAGAAGAGVQPLPLSYFLQL